MLVKMNLETTAVQPRLQAATCPRTGLDKPECHCPECVRELLDRFMPSRDGMTLPD
jgi:hypothetical protein